MRCANPNCHAMADNLFMGTLALVELETCPDNRRLHASGGFPICVTRTRYFWLCATCSRLFAIRKWNSSGLILEPRHRDGSRISDPPLEEKPSRRSRNAHGAFTVPR